MGRYSAPLAAPFADFAGVAAGQRALDVGCGPGALTAELVRRLGPSAVSAVDPSESFVAAMETRHPEVDVRLAPAEELPFEDDAFDATVAQLVVHFMPDPVAGLREMARVTREGGIVAACVWDHAGQDGPLSPFWEVVRALDGEVEDESELPGARQGHLAGSSTRPGSARSRTATSRSPWSTTTFEDWWEPYTLGVGPAGAYVAGLAPEHREGCARRCREASPPPRSSSARGPGRRAAVLLARVGGLDPRLTCHVWRRAARSAPLAEEGTRPVQATSCCMRVLPPASAAERLDEEAREGPRAVRRVRDHGVRHVGFPGRARYGTRLRRPSPPVRRGRPWGGARSRARSGAAACVSLRGLVISATRSSDTILPAKRALQSARMSAAVV